MKRLQQESSRRCNGDMVEGAAPEMQLVAAVIWCALADLRRRGRVRANAINWIWGKSGVPWSFEWCCDLVGLDAEAVRDSAMDFRRAA